MSCKRKFCAILSGLQEVPAVTTNAIGNVKAKLKGHVLTISGSFRNLSSPLFPVGQLGAAHIHLGNVGQNGAVAWSLNVQNGPNNLSGKFLPCANTFVLTPEQVDLLNTGNYYVNVHTQNFQSGEIRGQLLPQSDCCQQFVVNLSGANEVPPVTGTQGRGTIVATLNCRTLSLSGSFSNLSSGYVASHIHQGFSGNNGPVLFNLNATTLLPNTAGNYSRTDNSFVLTKEQVQLLKDGGLYVNIHTTNFPGGEIRGQLLAL